MLGTSTLTFMYPSLFFCPFIPPFLPSGIGQILLLFYFSPLIYTVMHYYFSGYHEDCNIMLKKIMQHLWEHDTLQICSSMSIKPNIDILCNPAILSHVSPQQKWMLMSTKHMYNNVHSRNISKKEMKTIKNSNRIDHLCHIL